MSIDNKEGFNPEDEESKKRIEEKKAEILKMIYDCVSEGNTLSDEEKKKLLKEWGLEGKKEK